MALENRRFLQISSLMAFFLFIGLLTWLYSLATSEVLPWGVFITNFIYFLGISQGVLVMAVILRVASARWSASLFRLAGVVALSFFPAALIMLLTIIFSKGAIFYWAEEASHSWFKSSFFVWRNLLSFFLFYGLALTLFNISWARKEEEKEVFNYRLLLLGFFLLLAFIFHQTVISWDLGMTLNPHFWTDTIYAPFFIVGSLYGGVAALILLMAFLRRVFGVESFKPLQFENMGKILLALSPIWFYFWWSQFLLIWFGNVPEETEALYLRIFSHYGTVYGGMMVFTFVIPFLMLIFRRVRNSIAALSGVSILILIGLWLERYLIVAPALVEEHKSVYTPVLSFTNLSITLGVFGGFFLLFLLLLRRYYPKVLPTREAETEDLLISEPQGW